MMIAPACFKSLDDGRVAWRRRRTNQHFDPPSVVTPPASSNRSLIEIGYRRVRAASRRRAVARPLVGGRRALRSHVPKEGTRSLLPAGLDCRERLFDELTAGEFSSGETMRKVSMLSVASSRPEPFAREQDRMPKRRAGERNGAQAGGVCKKSRRS